MSKIFLDPKIYVTSVKRGYESRQQFINQQMKNFGIEFDYMLKFDINDDIDNEKNYYFGLEPKELISAVQSLFLKHIAILKHVYNNDINMAIIFEDDAIFSDNFLNILNAAIKEYQEVQEPSVISLGHGNNIHVPHSKLKDGKYLYEGNLMRCADSYVVRYQEAKLIIDYIDNYIKDGNKISWPIDYFYSKSFNMIGIKFLWLYPSIVTQGSMNGMFHSALDSKRMKRSLLSNKIHYFTNFIVKRFKAVLK